MTNAFPVTGKGGSGLCAHIVTQVEPAQPSLLVLQKSPALHQCSSTFSLFTRLPFACFPSWAGMRCQDMAGKAGRDSSALLPSRAVNARLIVLAQPLHYPQSPFADALLEWCCALPGTGCLPAQPCFPGR